MKANKKHLRMETFAFSSSPTFTVFLRNGVNDIPILILILDKFQY